MKKKLFALIPLLGAFCLTGCGNSSNNEVQVDARSVDENWREHDCHIVCGVRDEHRYYTCEPGDYIFDIELHYEYPFVNGYCVTYNNNFYIWDDFETQFIFQNGYKTKVEKSYHPLGRDNLNIPREDTLTYHLKDVPIVKIRVRTVD